MTDLDLVWPDMAQICLFLVANPRSSIQRIRGAYPRMPVAFRLAVLRRERPGLVAFDGEGPGRVWSVRAGVGAYHLVNAAASAEFGAVPAVNPAENRATPARSAIEFALSPAVGVQANALEGARLMALCLAWPSAPAGELAMVAQGHRTIEWRSDGSPVVVPVSDVAPLVAAVPS